MYYILLEHWSIMKNKTNLIVEDKSYLRVIYQLGSMLLHLRQSGG